MSEKEGMILIGLGDHELHDLVEGVESPEDVVKMAMISISETPRYRTGSAASVAQHEAFVKYMNLMAKFIDVMEKEDDEKD